MLKILPPSKWGQYRQMKGGKILFISLLGPINAEKIIKIAENILGHKIVVHWAQGPNEAVSIANGQPQMSQSVLHSSGAIQHPRMAGAYGHLN